MEERKGGRKDGEIRNEKMLIFCVYEWTSLIKLRKIALNNITGSIRL